MFVTLVKALGERVLPVPAAIDDQADAVAVQQVDIVRGLEPGVVARNLCVWGGQGGEGQGEVPRRASMRRESCWQ